jgi:hypothetical protein
MLYGLKKAGERFVITPPLFYIIGGEAYQPPLLNDSSKEIAFSLKYII